MDVSENIGFSPKSSHFNRVFRYFHHPFWGCSPYFWKHPYDNFHRSCVLVRCLCCRLVALCGKEFPAGV